MAIFGKYTREFSCLLDTCHVVQLSVHVAYIAAALICTYAFKRKKNGIHVHFVNFLLISHQMHISGQDWFLNSIL